MSPCLEAGLHPGCRLAAAAAALAFAPWGCPAMELVPTHQEASKTALGRQRHSGQINEEVNLRTVENDTLGAFEHTLASDESELAPHHVPVPPAWNTASFLGGIIVGAMCTIVFVGCVMDFRAHTGQGKQGACSERPHAKTGHEPKLTSSKVEDPPIAERGEHGRNPEATGEPPQGDAAAPVESLHLFWPRAGNLALMLLVQSVSSIILAGFQGLIEGHSKLIFFLTMIVGLGGNAGGQSVVLTVRRLALGQSSPIYEQLSKGFLISVVVAPLAFARAATQGTGVLVCTTVGISVFCITIVATTTGTALPRLFAALRIDPAHATPVIQVLMDVIGIIIVCGLGVLLLEGGRTRAQ